MNEKWDKIFLEFAKQVVTNIMINEKWDKRFLELAKQVSTWSKDPSTQVGAILVQGRKVVGLGYNGFPAGVNDDPDRYANRELKYKMVVHAEVNALLNAGHDAHGATLYVYPSFALPPVCNDCCKAVINAGVKTIVGYAPDMNDPRVKRWLDSIAVSKDMCDEAGVNYYSVSKK